MTRQPSFNPETPWQERGESMRARCRYGERTTMAPRQRASCATTAPENDAVRAGRVGGVRARRFHGLKFRRQHPIGPSVVDFFCDHLRVVVEIDGPVHGEPLEAERDHERAEVIQRIDELGYALVRVDADEALADPAGALESALAEILVTPPRRRPLGPEPAHDPHWQGRDDQRRTLPFPSPPSGGEGTSRSEEGRGPRDRNSGAR